MRAIASSKRSRDAEPVALEPEVLDGGDAPPDAVVDPPAGQLVEQADVLDHP